MTTLKNLIIPVFMFLLMGQLPLQVQAKEVYSGPYRAEVYYIKDGDTFFARVHLWPGLHTDISIRIRGIDTPESWRPKCEQEENAGKAATQFLMDLFESPYRGAVLGKPMAAVTLKNVALGKFAGRVLADVYHAEKDVALTILRAGHGRPYTGGTRKSWCAADE